jgi:HSP20 family protein
MRFNDRMGAAFGGSTAVRAFEPAIDVRSDESAIRFELDVPGIRLSDLRIELAAGVLTIEGERRFRVSEGREQVLLGRAYGRFTQSFVVPDWADVEKLTAQLGDGVLTIEIPKRESARLRKIEVKALGGKAGDE